jgi:hypothetical protein
MRVYHGSYTEIDKIDYTKFRLYRDFGRGFYVTKIRSQAEVWAIRKGRDNSTDGFVTEFEFIETAFDNWELNCKRFDNYSKEWLDFVVTNRNTEIAQPSHNFDIVEGPVADDDVTYRINAYLQNKISIEQFLNDLKFRFPSHQICFCTHRSLQALKHITKDEVKNKIDDIVFPIIEKLIIDKGFTKIIATDKFYDSQTFSKLADKTTMFYEKDWTEIYKLLLKELNKC